MKKRQIIAVLLLVLCLFVCSGCQRISPELKAYMEQQLEEYEAIASEKCIAALTEKYGDGVIINEMHIVENKDYVHGFGDEPYQSVGIGKAELNGKVFDFYVQWNIESAVGSVCCDNLQKDEIIEDLDEYIYSLYGEAPYAKYYAIFPSLGYEFNRTDGMLQEKYNGNIEDYLTKFPKLINIALAYNVDDVSLIENRSEGENALEMSKKVYVVNTYENSLTEEDLTYIVLRGDMKIEELIPVIDEYWYFKNGEVLHWTNPKA